MSENWYLMTTPSQISGFESDYFTDYATDSFNELLSTFVGEDIIVYNSTLDVSSVVKGIVQSIYQRKNEKQILLPLNTSNIGMYIKHKNLYWLITDFVDDNKMYQNAVITLCNYILKFQSPTGTILSYPCITSTNNSVGIDEGNVISTLNSVNTIKLPFDENTKLIAVDDRFFIDKLNTKVYAVTNVNNTEFNYADKGLIELTFKANALQVTDGDKPKDRPDLGICNYIEPVIEPEPVEGYSYASILCSNPSNEIKIGSSIYRTLIPTFYEANGTITTETIVAVWDFEYPVGFNSSHFIIDYVGNQVKIKAISNYDLLGKTIKCNVMSSNGGFGGSITLSIII